VNRPVRKLDTDVNVSTVVGMAAHLDLAPILSSIDLDALEASDAPVLELEAEEVWGSEPPSVLAGTVAQGMALLVSPAVGRFQARAEAGLVGEGTVVAVVTGGGSRIDQVCAPVAAEVCGLLAFDGQLVQPGQPLAWLRRLDAA
jgi:biotin carboxyl carrier protein